MEPEPSPDRISDLYHQALACTPEERNTFLEAACGGNAALRDELESLLRYEADSARFLETPAAVAVNFGGPDTSQMIGRQFGPYRIDAPLGSGGMGEVYRARDSKLGRDVAIKILPSHLTADAERRSRFAREARLLATLNHPNIGAIYGLEETDGLSALVLELVEGPTLADRLLRGPLQIPESLAIARQIAEALDAAHEKGIVHRDLKPANVVLPSATNASGVPSGELRAKVLDFGLAKTMAVGREGDPVKHLSGSLDGSAAGRILGTPAYMSPEQARGQAVDKRTDIWAFGCVLFEMLVGWRAFDGETMSDTLVGILEREPDWEALPAETPTSIRTLLERCLRKNPRKRLHDVADALIEIDDSALPAASARSAAVQRPVAPGKSRESLAWVVASVLGMASIGMAVIYSRAVRPAPLELVEFSIAPADQSRFAGTAPEFEISPNGRHVAFAAYWQGVPMVWIRSLGALTARALPGTEGARSPFWSPDSRSVGFFANNELKTVLMSGGAPAVLCDVRMDTSAPPSGTWNRDNVIIFGLAGRGPLQRVIAGPARGTATPVTTLSEGEATHRWPWFLPDGQHFLYIAQGGPTNELRVGSLTSPHTASLGSFESHTVYAAGHLFFVRGGNLMAQPFDANSRQTKGDPLPLAAQTGVDSPWQRGMFSVSDTGRLAYSQTARTASELTWLDRQGKAQGRAGDPGVFFNLDLSPDERRVAVSQMTQQPGAKAQFDIWLIDLARSGAATRLTDDPAFEFDPAWSPSGERVAFNSNRPQPGKSAYSLFSRASNSSGEDETLVKSEKSIVAPDWSRDGRFVIYTREGSGTGNDLWTVPIDGDRQPQVFLATPHDEASATFSPDGRWIAYQSKSSGRSEVYVLPFPVRGGPVPVSRDGGWSPRWRGDGREIFFVSLNGSLMRAGIDTTNGFTATVPTQLFTTDLRPDNNRPYAVTKNGQRFLIPQLVPGTPITVVLDWRAKLAR